MKKNLLLLFFLLTLVSVRGQTNIYHSFPDSNAVWRESFSNNPCSCPNPCFNNCGYDLEYFINGDTVLGPYSYHKIYLISSYYSNNIAYPANTGFWGGIREDTVARKVFCTIPSHSVQDTLLYDFALNLGDTLKGYLASSLQVLQVDSVDSVRIGNAYRKRINFGPQLGGSELRFIEGVGFAAGLFDNSYTGEAGGQIICFVENSVALYPDSSCKQYLFAVKELDRAGNRVDVYPNPANSILKIKISGEQIVDQRVTLVNVFGEELRMLQASSGDLDVDISNLDNGIYFLKIVNGDKSYSKKIIIQH